MQAVILAAGLGRRVRPLSEGKAKAIFKVVGKPLLWYAIDGARTARITDFVIVVGHRAEQIRNYLEDGSRLGVNIAYAFQREALGMGNALEAAEDLLEERFLVINADDVIEPRSYGMVLGEFQRSGAEIVLNSKPVKETSKFGILDLDADERVLRIVEKPKRGEEPSNKAVISPYLVSKDLFRYLRKIPVSDHQYEDAIQAFIDDGNLVRAVSYDGFFHSFKFPWDLFEINRFYMDRLIEEPRISDDAEIADTATIRGRVSIGRGVRVYEGAAIKGPCHIGEESVIGDHALIRGYTSIGERCVVGHGTEMKNSIIGDDCWFHNNYIGDSVISDRCEFGAGSITANFRLDKKQIKVTIEGERKDTGRDKLGVIMAEGCRVGINALMMPGVKVGPNSVVGPNVILARDLGANRAIFVKQEYAVEDSKRFE